MFSPTVSCPPLKDWRRAALAVTGTLLLSACVANSTANPIEGIGFREARFQQIAAMREYRQCRDEGLEMDKQAGASSSAGAYLTSARILEKCESGIGPDGAGLSLDERLQANALSIQNYFKGGDVDKARSRLDQFKERFAGRDLYYPDGSSFILTMEALLGRKERWSFGEFAALNVNDTLKAEMRRMLHWKAR